MEQVQQLQKKTTNSKMSKAHARPSMQSLSVKQVQKAAFAAIRALAKNGLTNCCLFGSMACYLYGMKNRVPHDVDILISDHNTLDPEQIKRLIVSTDSNFFLVASVNPAATYKVLWYRISEKQKCKVDILVPGPKTTLNLPWVPHDRIVHIVPGSLPMARTAKDASVDVRSSFPSRPHNQTLPAMPLLVLLLLKLQGWHDHRHSREPRMQVKVPKDIKDVEEMLDLAVDEYNVHVLDYEEGWIPRSFLERTEGFVREYVKKWGGSREWWEYLGLL